MFTKIVPIQIGNQQQTPVNTVFKNFMFYFYFFYRSHFLFTECLQCCLPSKTLVQTNKKVTMLILKQYT